jgi:aspartyl-tRNA(Asn)/glutamyl-tRNA(Gln) amidotransferase subunit A
VPDYTASLVPEVTGLRPAVPHEYFVQGVQPGMEAMVRGY